MILAASKHYDFPFDPAIAIKNYTKEQRNFLLYGVTYPDFVKAHKDIEAPKKVSEGNFEGIIPHLLNLYKKNPLKASNEVKKYIVHAACIECNNSGFAKLAEKLPLVEKPLLMW